jgi:hypothetical protein
MVVVDDEYFNGASFRRGIGGGGGWDPTTSRLIKPYCLKPFL